MSKLKYKTLSFLLMALFLCTSSCEMIQGQLNVEEELQGVTQEIESIKTENAELEEQIQKLENIVQLPLYDANRNKEAYISQILLTKEASAPENWMFCEGQILNVASNQALFSLVGTMYGGDGRATFALPNLKAFEQELDGARYIICTSGAYPSRS